MSVFRSVRHDRAVLLLPLLLTACASVPNLGARPVPHGAADYASAASLVAAQSAWPADGWWRRYGDTQLDRLMDEALAGSPDLAAAAARLRTAEGYTQQAGAALQPSIDASGAPEIAKQSQHQSVPAAFIPKGWNDSGSLGVNFSLDLDLWGKNRAALRAAKADADAARFELEQSRLALTTSIASNYAELASLYAQRDSLESALQIRSQTAQLVARRVQTGLDTRAELKQAEANGWTVVSIKNDWATVF